MEPIDGVYRMATAVSLPELWAMNRMPCELSARCPPAGYDHTCACDARSIAYVFAAVLTSSRFFVAIIGPTGSPDGGVQDHRNEPSPSARACTCEPLATYTTPFATVGCPRKPGDNW